MNRRVIFTKSADPTSMEGYVRPLGIPMPARARLFLEVIWNWNIGGIVDENPKICFVKISEFYNGDQKQ